jgi:hypothetical protein
MQETLNMMGLKFPDTNVAKQLDYLKPLFCALSVIMATRNAIRFF